MIFTEMVLKLDLTMVNKSACCQLQIIIIIERTQFSLQSFLPNFALWAIILAPDMHICYKVNQGL